MGFRRGWIDGGRRRARAALFLSALAPASFAFAAGDVRCLSGGHGPYDETWESCARLGADQARTDCALNGQAAQVFVEGEGPGAGARSSRTRAKEPGERSAKRIRKVAECTASFDRTAQDCRSSCSPWRPK